jgi:hypothetical protein
MTPSPGSRDGQAIIDTGDAAAITAGKEAGTDQVSDVRSSDGEQAGRKQRPHPATIHGDGAAIAAIQLPVMSNDRPSIPGAGRPVNPRVVEIPERLIRRIGLPPGTLFPSLAHWM